MKVLLLVLIFLGILLLENEIVVWHVTYQTNLPNEYATEFFEKWNHSDVNIIICIIRFARIRYTQEQWVASSAYKCTEILMNPHLPEVENMRAKIIAAANNENADECIAIDDDPESTDDE